ncbi:hypothetical protein M8494_24525 [Serratia ureilytica]
MDNTTNLLRLMIPAGAAIGIILARTPIAAPPQPLAQSPYLLTANTPLAKAIRWKTTAREDAPEAKQEAPREGVTQAGGAECARAASAVAPTFARQSPETPR